VSAVFVRLGHAKRRGDLPDSVEMIEKHYAIHPKNRLDASAMNVLKPKAK